MSHRLFFTSAVLLFAWVSNVRGAAPSAPSVPDEALTSAGLVKVANYYLLELDQHLNDRLKEIAAAERKNGGISRQQQNFESDIAAVNADIAGLKAKIADLNDRKNRTTVRAHVARGFLDEQINQYNAQIKADETRIDKDKTDSAALQPVDVGSLNTKLADEMDSAADTYAQFQKDASITDALAAVNQAGPKVKLGPSINFQQTLPRIRAARTKAQNTPPGGNASSATTAPSNNR